MTKDTHPGLVWPNALIKASELIQERGFSNRRLEDDDGSLAVDRALQIALGYVTKELDGGALTFTAPDASTKKVYELLLNELAEHLKTIVEHKLPSVGFWNYYADKTSAVKALKQAGTNFNQ